MVGENHSAVEVLQVAVAVECGLTRAPVVEVLQVVVFCPS